MSIRKKEENTGFSNKVNRAGRLVRADGAFAVERTGADWRQFNPYHALVNQSWSGFFVVIFVFYTIINLIFTLLYLLVGVEHLSSNGEYFPFWKDFFHAFFFSIQTFTTIGYGSMAPLTLPTSIISSIEALAGIMSAALMSGLFFARFSRPVSSIIFSKSAIVAPYEGGTALMFRCANRSNSNMSKLSVKATLAYIITMPDGQEKRDYDTLELETSQVEMLPLNWTIVHPLTENSPLWQKTEAEYADMNVEILVTMAAHDDTFAQVVYSRHSYRWDEIKFAYKFQLMYHTRTDGITILDLAKIDAMEKVVLTEKA
jgi:inward rectifier potassium channel